MEVICLEDEALYKLVELVTARLQKNEPVVADKWISKEECMKLLNVSSPTTLQKLRDEGKIRFSHPEPKLILYDRDSINAYLDKHAKDTF